ncbi:MAG: toll/interleukin-1 receptor domain-containing protein [Thioploca sp.]|nr:toll/interleukin-1 receptor domain-containing protein [Thioploca sp.]
MRAQVVRLLARYAITTWRHDRDIQEGSDFTRAIEEGIETADNFLYFLSPAALQSHYCQTELRHALQYHKRIIPLLISLAGEALPEALWTLQYLDFTQGIHVVAFLRLSGRLSKTLLVDEAGSGEGSGLA